MKIDEGGLVDLQEDMADPFVPGRALADGEYGWPSWMGDGLAGIPQAAA
jgi:hypothetical protein